MITSNKYINRLKEVLPDPIKVVFRKILTPIRLLSKNLRVTPDFVVVGCQKGGSTAMFNYLVEHPQIIGSFSKEVRYFTLNPEKDLSWYRSHFPTSIEMNINKLKLKKKVISGESTPDYLFSYYTAEGLKKVSEDVKVIALLRNPIDRIVSAHNYALKRNAPDAVGKDLNVRVMEELNYWEDQSIDEFFNRPECHDNVKNHTTLIGTSLYFRQLERIFQSLPRENILVIQSEKLFEDTSGTLKEIEEFLGIDHFKFPNLRPFNQSKKKVELNEKSIERLSSFFHRENQLLYDLIGQDFDW